MNSTKPTTTTSTTTKSETTRLLVPHSLAIDFHIELPMSYSSVCHTSAAGPTSIAQLKRVSSLFLFFASGGHQPVRSTCDAFSSVV
jgi:hypothetical protein